MSKGCQRTYVGSDQARSRLCAVGRSLCHWFVCGVGRSVARLAAQLGVGLLSHKNMPEVNFKLLPTDYQELISAFKKRVEQSEKYTADFDRRHYNGTREKAVIYCLRHTVDLAKGCLVTAQAELPDSLTTLSRALLETFF
jgi:hypothetical protein